MDTEELFAAIAEGEDSKHQFSANVRSSESLAQDLVAFSNSQGGSIFVGVTVEGNISGLTYADIKRLNQLVSNAAADHVRPPVGPITQKFSLPDGKVMVISVTEGVSKPYMDRNLHVYLRSGAENRKVDSREDLFRIFQSEKLTRADALPVENSSTADIDKYFFDEFFEREYGISYKEQESSLTQVLENMRLAEGGRLNIAGTLLFASRPQYLLPVFHVKAVAFPSTEIQDVHYIDSRDVKGRLSYIFREAMSFLLSNIRHVQNNQGFNSIGEPEIPRIVFEELVANALVHRDYFVSAPVKVLIFTDRIEIISPGHLPNNLTIENIKMGNSNVRNPILASFSSKLLPYRGLGSGIIRAMKAYPDIEFVDDRDGNSFRVTILRKSLQ